MSANFVTDNRLDEPNERTSLMSSHLPVIGKTLHEDTIPMETSSPARLLTPNGDAVGDQDLSATTFDNELV